MATSDPAGVPRALDASQEHLGAPYVPGYRTDRLLGFGGSGEVWAATSEDDGEPVALKVLRGGAEDAERWRRETVLLRRVDHPHVVRLRAVEEVEGCGPVLVLDRALGGSLAALVAARGPLDVGEVVTVLSPLAGALADLHERGLVHGDVAPGNVLFDGQGRPVLGDLGLARLVGEGPAPDLEGTVGFLDPARFAGAAAGPASDVFGIAAVAWLALTGRAPQPPGQRPPLVAVAPGVPVELARLLEECLSPDVAARPSARTLAIRAFESWPAAPVRLVPTDPAAAPAEVVTHRLRVSAAAPAPEPGRHRGARRRLGRGWRSGLVAGVAVAAVLAASAVLLPRWLEPGGVRPAAASTRASSVEEGSVVPPDVDAALRGDDPAAAVPALAWLRARAFAAGERVLLERANAAGGAARAEDDARLEALSKNGIRLEGLSFDVRDVTVVSRSGPAAVVDVSLVTLPHRRASPSGSVEVAEGEERTSRLTLRRAGGDWQVVSAG